MNYSRSVKEGGGGGGSGRGGGDGRGAQVRVTWSLRGGGSTGIIIRFLGRRLEKLNSHRGNQT